MPADRVESIRSYVSIQQQPHDFQVPILRGEAESQVTVFRSRVWKQMVSIFYAAGGRGQREGDSSPASQKPIDRLQFEKDGRGLRGAIRIRSTVAKQVDQIHLHAAFARDTSGRNQHQRLIE